VIPVLEAVQDALARNDLDAARQALAPLIKAAPGRHDIAHHLALGAAAEELGEWKWAETAYNLVLREEKVNPVARERLAELAAEAGDLERAAVHREAIAEARPEDTANLLALQSLYRRLAWREQARRIEAKLSALGVSVRAAGWEGADEAAEEPADRAGEEPGPDLASLVNPPDGDIARFLALFSGREDVHARQWFSPRKGVGGYSPVDGPLTPRLVRQHLFGDETLGVYPIRLDGTCVFFALDLDLTSSAIEWARRGPGEAQEIRERLHSAIEHGLDTCRRLGLEPLVEDSGYKGRHFWFFLERPERASHVHAVVKAVAAAIEDDLPAGISIEVFPKQARRKGKGYGNLIKLPLGIHRRTGRRSWLLGPDLKPAARPFDLLRRAHRITHREFFALADRLAGAGDGDQPPWADELPDAASPPRPASPEPPPPAPEVAVQPPPAWTDADYSRHPVISHLLASCPVLSEIVRRAVEERHLEHDEIVVLQHVLGHLPGGVAAANYAVSRTVGHDPACLLKSPLRGNPVSCAKIRKRVPHITSRVSCNCEFPDLGESYPSPVLHAAGRPAGAASPATPAEGEEPVEETARRWLALLARARAVNADLARLQAALVDRIGRAGGTLLLPEGRLTVVVRDGTASLDWNPEPSRSGGEGAP